VGRVGTKQAVFTKDPEVASPRDGVGGWFLGARVIDLRWSDRLWSEFFEQRIDVGLGVADTIEGVLYAELLEELGTWDSPTR
jgi:hypothetical protein